MKYKGKNIFLFISETKDWQTVTVTAVTVTDFLSDNVVFTTIYSFSHFHRHSLRKVITEPSRDHFFSSFDAVFPYFLRYNIKGKTKKQRRI